MAPTPHDPHHPRSLPNSSYSTIIHEVPSATSKGKARVAEPDTCVICLEPLAERAITVPCNHWFDFLCIASWLQDHPTCPLCKTDLSAVQYDWRSPFDFKTYLVQSSTSTECKSTNNNTTQYPPGRRNRNNPRGFRNRPYNSATRFSPTQTPSEAAALRRRRHIYTHNLYSLHVGSNRLSQYRDIRPSTISTSRPLQSRARLWIRRELGVFSFLAPVAQQGPKQTSESTTHPAIARRASNAEFLLEYIISILKTVELKGSSGKAEEMLSDFLGEENARLFCHELLSWLRSPYTELGAWDRHVQYRVKLPRFEDEVGACGQTERGEGSSHCGHGHG